MNTFTFDLGDPVKMTCSNETGTVIGRAQFQHSDDSYLVRYRAGDGRQVESWWNEGAIIAHT